MPQEPDRVAIDRQIRGYRAGEATVTVTAGGVPLAGREVVVAQRRHAFLFGCIGFDLIDLANADLAGGAGLAGSAGLAGGAGLAGSAGLAGGVDPAGGTDPLASARQLADQWFELFNFATLPFYWGRFEPHRGRPDTARLLRAAEWFVARGCPVKGHPLAWHTVTADWLTDLSDAEITAAQLDRIRREVKDFAGVVDMWDVINEVVIMPIFDRYDNGITRICRRLGRIPLVRMVFEAAEAANPQATLLLNDFDMSAAYECLIEGLLEAGIRIDALGLQSHMHQGYWGEERTLQTIDRFARYGLPIHFTETTLVSGHLMPPEIVDLNDYQVPHWPSTPDGEERQADELVRHVRTLLSHPAVQAMTYWGLSDADSWLGAPGGLVRADGTPKPSYQALHSLIKGEWWLAPTVLHTDADGRVEVRGFLGDYELTVDGTTTPFAITTPGQSTLQLAI